MAWHGVHADEYEEVVRRANERGDSLDHGETQPPDAGLDERAPLDAVRMSPSVGRETRRPTRTARRIQRRQAALPYAPRREREVRAQSDPVAHVGKRRGHAR
jgi:hypothetical protein